MTYHLEPYPVCKDSAVPWLGDVPEHWDVRRLRNTAEMRVSSVDKHTKDEEHPVRLCNYMDVYKNDRINERLPFMRATASREEIERFRLQLGDVLITKDSEAWNDIGVPALVDGVADDVICGYHLALLRPLKNRLSGAYLFCALQSRAVAHQFRVEANGVTRYGLSHAAIKSVWLPLPPLPEQAAIVRFLDHADQRIRRYISAKQKLIKLLEEQKQAIIRRAVTRGPDPNVCLKPSGVEWLGDVPEHWEVRRLKSIVSRVTSGSRGWSEFASDTGALFLRIGNLTRSSIALDESNVIRLQLPKAVLGEAARTRVRDGDILLSITAFIGSVAVVPADLEEAYVSQHVACCRMRPGAANSRWVAYVLLSPVGQTHGQLSMYGGTKQGLSLDDVKDYVVLLPPVDEQTALVRWIDGELGCVDVAIERAQREIALLHEYRTRLISDVVTGKLDVREAAARLPDEVDEAELLDEADALFGDDEAADDGLDASPDEVEE
jgi:type I restriction enzyme S subunit